MPRPLGEAGGRRGGRASTAINGLIVSYSSVFTKFSHEEQPALPKGHAVLNGSVRGQRAVDRDFDALRLRLTAAEPPDPNRNDALIYILTARTRGEGVSTVCAGLARSFAKHDTGRVLLLDAKSRGNGHTKGPGAANAVSGIDFDEAIRRVEDWQVDVLSLAERDEPLPSGAPWEDYFSGLRARYDVIVVDAGALDSRSPYYWSEKANHVLLVVDSTRTSVQALQRLRKDLKTAKLTITGVVLNKREYPIPKMFY